jgi:hypothetical protein
MFDNTFSFYKWLSSQTWVGGVHSVNNTHVTVLKDSPGVMNTYHSPVRYLYSKCTFWIIAWLFVMHFLFIVSFLILHFLKFLTMFILKFAYKITWTSGFQKLSSSLSEISCLGTSNQTCVILELNIERQQITTDWYFKGWCNCFWKVNFSP